MKKLSVFGWPPRGKPLSLTDDMFTVLKPLAIVTNGSQTKLPGQAIDNKQNFGSSSNSNRQNNSSDK